jgi:hypothetical protein
MRLTNNAAVDRFPTWSPDGQKLAFFSLRDGNYELYVINADGSGTPARLTANAADDVLPVWSPDGQQIAFVSTRDGQNEIYTMPVAGSATPTRLTNDAASDTNPDWQPRTYPHPAATIAMTTPLVPVLRPITSDSDCSARGGTPTDHEAPFAIDSCNPPLTTADLSAYLGSDGVGSATLTTIAGDPTTTTDEADYGVSVSLTDIRSGSFTGADYAPDMTLVVRLRVTDKRSCAPSGCSAGYYQPATTTDLDFSVPISCTDTASVAIGATCNANTSADAVLPGDAILESRQTVIDVFRIRINDAGLDLIRGNADDKLLAQQGAFIP